MSLSSYKHSIKFEYRQFPSIFVGVMPLLELRILEIPVHSFPQFSPTCIDILSWNLHEKTTREIKINLIVKLTFCCAIFKQKFVNLHVDLLRYFLEQLLCKINPSGEWFTWWYLFVHGRGNGKGVYRVKRFYSKKAPFIDFTLSCRCSQFYQVKCLNFYEWVLKFPMTSQWRHKVGYFA